MERDFFSPWQHNIKSVSKVNTVTGLFWNTVNGEGKGPEGRLENVLGRSRCSRDSWGGKWFPLKRFGWLFIETITLWSLRNIAKETELIYNILCPSMQIPSHLYFWWFKPGCCCVLCKFFLETSQHEFFFNILTCFHEWLEGMECKFLLDILHHFKKLWNENGKRDEISYIHISWHCSHTLHKSEHP